MNIHEIIGYIFTGLLLAPTGIAALWVAILIFRGAIRQWDADIAVIGSQYVAADGSWNFEKGDLPEERFFYDRESLSRIPANYDATGTELDESVADEAPKEENTDIPVVEFQSPDYDVLKARKEPKILMPN